MDADSVWFGDGHQGFQDRRKQGTKGIAGLPPEVLGPRGRYLTGLVEPCGALPRKCLFIYLFIYYLPQEGIWHQEIQSVETRCRGRAGGQKIVPLTPSSKASTRWVDKGTKEFGNFTGEFAAELLDQLRNEEDIEDHVLHRMVGEDRIGVGPRQRLRGRKVFVYHHDEFDEDDRFNRVRGVWIEQDGEIGETTADTYEGTG
jgi:hypothetical protein